MAIQQHAKREAVAALRQCLQLLESLPDAQSLHWKRERLGVMALYAPTYTHLVGTQLSGSTFAQLLALCSEVQQMIDSQRTEQQPSASDGIVVADQTVVQTFYALRGYYFGLCGSNLLNDAHALAPRIEALARASNDLLLLHHSWIVLSVFNCERGRVHLGVEYADRIVDTYYQQQAVCPTPYVVNPLAPMDPVTWGLGISIQLLPMLGAFADVVRRSERVLLLAESRGEPVAYQESIYHVLYGKLYVEVAASDEVSKYWAHVRSTGFQMVSLQLECLFTMQIDPRERWSEFSEGAERVWAKFSAGAHFLLTLSWPLLQMLLSAGMWREGMAVVDRWKARCVTNGWVDFNHSECQRYQAQFKLLQAHERLTDDTSSRTSRDSAVDELIASLAELHVGIQRARENRWVLMEARCLLTSVYIRQLLLHITPFPASELPFTQIMAPPHITLDEPFHSLECDDTTLVGVTVVGVREQQARLVELLVNLEGQSDDSVQSSFFHRARVVVGMRF